MTSGPAASPCKKLVVLVVHGVGEQRCFDQLETIAGNIFRAVKNNGREPIVQVHFADQVVRCAAEHSWCETPVSIRWQLNDDSAADDKSATSANGCVEASFREVHWADLDVELNFVGWWKFVAWALSIMGVRFFPKKWPGMRSPRRLPGARQFSVRAKLFFLSFFFLMLLGTVGLLDIVLKRFSVRIKLIEHAYKLFFDYLGDIKLYQDWFLRSDTRPEVIGKKSRVAIRQRMARALLRMASDVIDDDSIDGFYIVAHSLGTVVAFNVLMDTELTLPCYLTEREWKNLSDRLKKSEPQPPPPPRHEWPMRGPWLDPYKGGYAAIDRAVLFKKFRGFLTLGSPLDRFAAIWPAIVPINAQSVPVPVPWINVYDVQDPIAGGDIKFFDCSAQKTDIGGLSKPVNIAWPDRFWFFRAHNSYWNTCKGKERLMDALMHWIEEKPFKLSAACSDAAKRRAKFLKIWYLCTLAGISVILLLVFAILVRLGTKLIRPILEDYKLLQPLAVWLKANFIDPPHLETIPFIAWCATLVGIALIVSCSIVRRLWEQAKFDR
ncbi:MAG: hypothetical protein HY308_02840 [Gammaproteobacteria bacterium]|nr:hypothetical protein [Gammaproteobacteria bacterium]